jgi:S-DNA-T family DNA segregation ATPase FtsK/SpoIIIE
MQHGTVKHLARIWWDCIGWSGWVTVGDVAPKVGMLLLIVSALVAPTSALVGLIMFWVATHIDDLARVRKRANRLDRGADMPKVLRVSVGVALIAAAAAAPWLAIAGVVACLAFKNRSYLHAVKAELGITEAARKRVWFRRMCEVLEIPSIPQVLEWGPTNDGEQFVLRIVVTPRFGTKEFMDKAGKIRDYAGKDVMRVHITQDPDRGGRIYLRLVTKDLTRQPLSDWPGLDVAPATQKITAGILVGKDAGAQDVRLDVVNDALFVAGQRGTGKSSLLQQIVAGAAMCEDVELYLGDLKDGAEFYAWRDRVTMFADNPDATSAMIDELLKLRASRSRALTKMELRKWRPGCGLPFLLCVIDEVAELEKGEGSPQSKLTRLVRLGRAQGIGVVLATQRPSHDWIDTSLRANCNVAMSFRVKDSNEANVALGAGAVGAGYLPHQLPKPGVFLILGDDEQTPRRCRSYWLSDADVAAIVAKLPARMSDEATELATGVPKEPIEAACIEASEAPDRLSATGGGWGTPLGPPLVAPEPPDLVGNPIRQRVWKELVEHPGWSTRGRVARNAMAAGSTVSKMLREWEDGGWVEKRGQQWRRRVPVNVLENVS